MLKLLHGAGDSLCLQVVGGTYLFMNTLWDLKNKLEEVDLLLKRFL